MTTTDTPRGRGRPSTGVRVDIRIPAELLARIDERATINGMKRPEMIRRLLTYAVGHPVNPS